MYIMCVYMEINGNGNGINYIYIYRERERDIRTRIHTYILPLPFHVQILYCVFSCDQTIAIVAQCIKSSQRPSMLDARLTESRGGRHSLMLYNVCHTICAEYE